MRSRFMVLPTLGAFLLALATCWRLAGAPNESIAPPKAPPIAQNPALNCQLRGAGSCAAAACHNADLLAGPGRHEYRLAIEVDPTDPTRLKDRHAQAYAVLTEERSQKIVRRLHPGQPHVRAETDALCVKCHVHPEFKPNYKDTPVQWIEVKHGKVSTFRAEEGVSCEACHGAASPWLSTHLSADWSEQLANGHTNTRSLPERARLCAGCHIGTRDMDVNHDLIAAGHPRLTFEFSSFHAILHKHWDHAKDTDPNVDPRGRTDFEARAWMLGQVVSAQVALELLAFRADEKSGRTWPDFAEHDCTACHHSFDPKLERIKAGYDKRRPGVLPQNRWYVAMLPRALDGLGLPADDVSAALEDIRKGLETLPPKRKPVAEQARKLAALLGKRLAGLSADVSSANPPANWRARFASLAERSKDSDDDYVQLFMARAAVSRASNSQPPPRSEMRLLLQIPTSNRYSTIDGRDYRRVLAGLKGNGNK